jgi:hypothetical protein
VRGAPSLMRVPLTIRALELPDWLIMSGAVYQRVLNALTERAPDYEVTGAETHAAAVVRPRTRPGRSPVSYPFRQVVVPFTMTILIPRAGRAGSTKSPTSLTLSGSNTTRSAYAPFRSTPRSGKPNHFAGRPHAAHGLFQREQPDITRIMTEHARERAPQGCRGRPMRSAGFSRINRAITTCARTSARFSATTSQSHRGTSERRRLHGWMSLQ